MALASPRPVGGAEVAGDRAQRLHRNHTTVALRQGNNLHGLLHLTNLRLKSGITLDHSYELIQRIHALQAGLSQISHFLSMEMGGVKL
jgi:hypothetical protein